MPEATKALKNLAAAISLNSIFDRSGYAAHNDLRESLKQAWSCPMRSLPAFVIGLLLISGVASAQDCGPFFWLCQRPADTRIQPPLANEPRLSPRDLDANLERQSIGGYGRIDPSYVRRAVYYPSSETPGTIVIDVQNHFLYFIEGSGRAIRYGIGVGKQGFSWSGTATIRSKQEWPDWYPPKEMMERKPELMSQVSVLQSGLGVPGGPANPLGARALYLWQGNKDTLYRIHGTNEPETIGRNVSSGCIRMLNQDVIDLYQRTPLGAKVVVLASDGRAAASASAAPATSGTTAQPPGTRPRR
jgi:lipoprotein-anchoring transpeptidase ErfK/SrfK